MQPLATLYLFSHSTIDEYSRCFLLHVTTNSVAMNIFGHIHFPHGYLGKE